jgi:uncharacterized membrane protein YgcG
MVHYYKLLLRVLLITLTLLLAGPAFALDCESIVVDETGKVDDTTAVNAAARRLSDTGADVRVRVIASTAAYGNNMDRWFKEALTRCTSWQSANGKTIKRNVVVIAVSMDKKAGIYFGQDFDDALNANASKIRHDNMFPRFKKGDIAGGLAAGLDGVRESIRESRPSSTDVKKQTAPAQPPVIINQAPAQPTDLSGLWTFLKWALLAFVLGVIGYLIVVHLRKRNEARAAQQGAQSKKTACSSRILELNEPFVLLKSKVGTACGQVSTEDGNAFRLRLTELEQRATRIKSAFADLQVSSNDPRRNGLSAEEYQRMIPEYSAILTELQTLAEDRNTLEEEIDGIQECIANASMVLADLEAEIHVAAEAIAMAQEQGFKTEFLEAVLAEAMAKQEGAKAAQTNKEYKKVNALCGAGTKVAKKVVQDAAGIAARKTKITTDITALEGRITQVRGLIPSCSTTIKVLKASYAASSLETITYADTEAGRKVDSASKGASEAKAASSDQDWKKAEDLITAGGLLLNQAEAAVSSVTSLQQSLEAAKHDAASEVLAAQNDVTASVAFNKKVDDDVDDAVWDGLKLAQEKLDQAKKELKAGTPDYLLVLKLAKEAHGLADKTMDQARNEHAQAERARVRVASALRDARTSVSNAAQYIERNAMYAEQDARRALETAQMALHSAENTEVPQDVLMHARAAESAASEAEQLAKSSVERAQRLRRERPSSYGTTSIPSKRRRETHVHHHHYERDDGDDFLGDAIKVGAGIAIGSYLSDDDDRESRRDSNNDDGPTFGGTSETFDTSPDSSPGGSESWGD